MNLQKRKLGAWVKTLSKHWSWRALVGIMALVGCVTTITSLYSDVIVPVFFQERVVRREAELSDLIGMFLPDSHGRGPDWTTAATPDSPIEWSSDERNGEIPVEGFERRYSAARHGCTTVLVAGKPTHDQFDKTIHPALWTISLYGCMAGVECVQISSSGYASIPENLIKSVSRHLTLVDVHPENGYTFTGRLYKVEFPAKGECWLVEVWSIGNHAWFVDLVLFPGANSHQEAKEYLDDLLSESY